LNGNRYASLLDEYTYCCGRGYDFSVSTAVESKVAKEK